MPHDTSEKLVQLTETKLGTVKNTRSVKRYSLHTTQTGNACRQFPQCPHAMVYVQPSPVHSPTRSTGLCNQCNTQSHTFHRTVQPVLTHSPHTFDKTATQYRVRPVPQNYATSAQSHTSQVNVQPNTQSHTSQVNVQPNTQSHTSQENVQSSHVPGICTIIANRFPEAHKGDAMEHNPFRHVQAVLRPIGAIDRSPVRHVQAVVCRYKGRQCSDTFRQ